MDRPSGTESSPRSAAGLLLRLGRDASRRDPERALECFAEAAELARTGGDRPGEARARQLAAATELARGRHDAAREGIDAALAIVRSGDDDDALLATCLNTRGLLALREGRIDDARTDLREALGRTRESPGDHDAMLTRAGTLETLGLVDRETGQPAQAALYFQEALELRRAADDRAGIASCRNHLGNLCFRMARFADAITHFELALKTRRELRDRHGIASTANNLAGALLQQGKLRESEALFRESRAIAEELGETRRVASITSNQGLLLMMQGRVDEAGEHHRESLRLHREIGDVAGQAHAHNNLASLEVERGRPDEALRHADECVALWKDAGRVAHLAKPLVNRGDALLELGRVVEARASAEAALEAADRADSDEYRAEGAALLSSALLAERRFDEARAAAERSLEHARAAGSPPLEAASQTALGRVHAECGDLDAAKLALESSWRLLRGIRHPYERATLLAEQGRLLGRVGAAQAGAERLRRALEEFERLGNARAQARVMTDLAPLVEETDPAEARRLRLRTRELAERHDLGSYLASVEARAAVRTGAAAGAGTVDVASLDALAEIAHALRDASSRGLAGCVDALLPVARRRLRARHVTVDWSEAVARRLRAAGVDAPEPASAAASPASTAPAAESLAQPLGRGDDSPGTLRAERDAPFDDVDRAWAAAAAALLALAAETHLERLDRVATEAPLAETVERCGDLVGSSAAMREVYRLIEHVAPTATSALLLGESGTGKELAARAIHARSPRRGAAFVAINCPSIPRELIESELFGHEKGAFTGADAMRPGKVEVADGGTLFLDEVGDMAIGTQVKLLRFLEERQFQRVGGTASHAVDVRILAATSRDLDDAIRRGEFREDLYYRLNVVPIRMPGLRERREDLPQLVAHLLARVATAGRETPPRVSAGAMDRLTAYDWPGNVRELRNTLEYMATVGKGDVLEERHLPAALAKAVAKAPAAPAPAALRAGESLESRLQELEATLVRAVLEAEEWNQSAAARRLGITESKIRNRMKQFGIRKPSGEAGGTS